MSALFDNGKNPPPVNLSRRGLVKWKQLLPALTYLLKKAGLKIHVDGMDMQEIDGGVSLRSQGSDTLVNPLSVTSFRTRVTVAFGTFCGRTPKIGSSYLYDDPVPELAITGSGTEFIAIKSTWDLTFAHGFMNSASLPEDGVEIVVTTTDPTILTSEDGIFYVVLATLLDGNKTGQAYTTSVSGGVRDHGDQNSKADLIVG
jgi:hypothetical protein